MSEEIAPPGETVRVGVVVVSYNTRDWLRECLSALPAAAHECDLEVTVVDNASTDGSADMVSAEFPNVRLVRNSENVGFGRAVNQGAELVSGDYVLLTNPDGYLRPGAIDALVSFAIANPQYVVCGGRTEGVDGQLDPRSCWAAPTLWSLASSAMMLSTLFPGSRLFDPEAMGWFRRDRARAVDVVTGCLFLMSMSDWRALGGFDERYFVYGEDADLCLRAMSQTGRRCAITPSAVMVHAVSASSESKPDKQALLLRGRISVVTTHLPGWRGMLGRRLIVLGVLTRTCVELLGVRRGARWREVWGRRKQWAAGYPSEPVVASRAPSW